MISLLLATVAEATEPPPPTERDWVEVRHRARRTRRAGLVVGFAGVGLAVAGGAIGAASCGSDPLCGLAVAVFAAPGVLVAEVGAPIALAGARRERTAVARLGLAPPGGRAAADVGWGLYAGANASLYLIPAAPLAGLSMEAVQARSTRSAEEATDRAREKERTATP